MNENIKFCADKTLRNLLNFKGVLYGLVVPFLFGVLVFFVLDFFGYISYNQFSFFEPILSILMVLVLWYNVGYNLFNVLINKEDSLKITLTTYLIIFILVGISLLF